MWPADLPPSGSQLLEVLDAAGAVLRVDSIDRNGASVSEARLPSLPAGVHELRATTYAGPGVTGGAVARTSTVVDLCGNGIDPPAVAVGTTGAEGPVRADVAPKPVRLLEQRSARFVPLTPTRTGSSAFVPVGSVGWSVEGGVGTVTPAGVFTSTAAGSGAVVATVSGVGTALAPVQVDRFEVRRGKWTVMVFMNAANDLYQYSDLNVNQMELVAQNPDVRFVVQWKQDKRSWPDSSFDGVRRYLVRPDSDPRTLASELLQSDMVDADGHPVDMGNHRTLNEFVAWSKQYFPADRYALVVWNHGNGWLRRPEDDDGRAFSYDDQRGTSIKVWEIDQAFAGHRFDVLAWDASLMQMLEVAYEARSYADYIVGSEESPPGEGYPYDAVFGPFRDRPDSPTRELTKSFVDGMLNDPRYGGRKITQSVIDTSRLEALAQALDGLGLALFANRLNFAPAIAASRQEAQSYSPRPFRTYRDLVDLGDRFVANGLPSAVVDATRAVQTAVRDAIVWEGSNAQSPRSHGVSIDFSDGSSFQDNRLDYLRMKLAQDTSWDEFLSIAP